MYGTAKRILAAVAPLVWIACASAKRNPVLDDYPAGVNGRTSVFYYDVHGSTVAELRADMRKLGPKIDGTSFVGETRSPMRWTWRTESTGGAGCTIREVTVFINAQMTLPRWTPPANADSSVITEWNRFLTALEVHEAGHKDISAKAGRQIIDRLRGVSSPCALLSARANDVARDIVTRAHQEQVAYDLTTRHGLTQGTGFGTGWYVAKPTDPLTLLVGPSLGTVLGTIPVPLDRAWSALPAAFSATGLGVNAVDSSAHAMGDSMVVRGTIGLLPVSEFADCGAPPSGRDANSVPVALFVTARLQAIDSSSTRFQTTVQAVARPVGNTPIICQSSGVFERRVVEALRRRLTGSPAS